ncbi:hypothetical protein IEQ34_014820 [Dendrobium chrysotoxum]|uniref:Uncharacterized protein n=1 Tax=Dendrobium chrysotoxum TaxID=161865 RepID=A0AAV7GMI1_DENCH|nr:hypothetical protein IEQ34_014820 [Dendrobium chrysotoxum]
MEDFPFFCDQCIALGNSRLDCHKLLPHLVDNPGCTMAINSLHPHVVAGVAISEPPHSFTVKEVKKNTDLDNPHSQDLFPVIGTPRVALKVVHEAIIDNDNISNVICPSYVYVYNMEPKNLNDGDVGNIGVGKETHVQGVNMNNIGVSPGIVDNMDVCLVVPVHNVVVVLDSDLIPFSPPPDVVQQFKKKNVVQQFV